MEDKEQGYSIKKGKLEKWLKEHGFRVSTTKVQHWSVLHKCM